MSTYTSKDAKLTFNGIEIPSVTEVNYKFDQENGLREERLLGPTQHFTIPVTFQMSEAAVEFFKWLGWRMFPSITPDGAVGAACCGVFVWRLLAELHEPLHRRSAMAPLWVKAMQARYWVNTIDENGKPIGGVRGFYLKGNQREVIEAYDRIRREAGDFSVDELGGLN